MRYLEQIPINVAPKSGRKNRRKLLRRWKVENYSGVALFETRAGVKTFGRDALAQSGLFRSGD